MIARHLVFVLLLGSGCGGKATPAPSPAPPSTPVAPIVALSADGKSLADGEWLSCHGQQGQAVELHDGEFEYNGGQASVGGTYELAPGKVIVTPSDPAKWAALMDSAPTEFAAAADLSTIGGMPCHAQKQ